MNEQDKEAFDEWFIQRYRYDYNDLVIPESVKPQKEAWQAACEYKKKKLDAYVRRDEIVKELEAENAKLREALKNCPILGEVHRDSNDRFKEWNLEYKYVLKDPDEAGTIKLGDFDRQNMTCSRKMQGCLDSVGKE